MVAPNSLSPIPGCNRCDEKPALYQVWWHGLRGVEREYLCADCAVAAKSEPDYLYVEELDTDAYFREQRSHAC